MSVVNTSTVTPERAVDLVSLHCLNCETEIKLPHDPNRKFEPHCPECHGAITLVCVGCRVRYRPERWRFGKDGRPTNRFHSKPCGFKWLSNERARKKQALKEEMERKEGRRETLEELETLMRLDPAYEARRGILDCAICRECGFHSRGHSLPKHLGSKHEGMTTREYRLRYPGAPLMSIAEFAASPYSGTDDPKEQAERLADRYVTPEQLAECRGESLEWETGNKLDCVVCRHCGEKLKDNLAASHLAQHGLTRKEYQALYPKAPLRRAAVNEDGRRRYKELCALASVGRKLRKPKKAKEETAITQDGRAVESAIPDYVKLFTDAAVRKSPQSQLTRGVAGFSRAQLDAALNALGSRDASQRPCIAARYFVSAQTGKSYETVAEHHRDHVNAQNPRH
jgi:hypothetical protein